MKVTLLGHATVLVELQGANILMDPVLQDPFEEGAVVSCPKRVIHQDRLPRLDTIIISHAHPDHFDIPSLACLPRECDVLCPEDRSIVYALNQLGFRKVHPTPAMQSIRFKGYELLTTRSSVSNVVEFGILFKDSSGVFWNQVDTVLSPQTITAALQEAKHIDLLFAMHASQNFDFFHSRSTTFSTQYHALNLNTVTKIRATVTVPGSAGFRFAGDIEWCNAFLFPMSREKFIEDLARLDPQLRTAIANPGDVFEIARGEVRQHAGLSNVAAMVDEDSWRLRFDPCAAVPALTDSNPDRYSIDQMEQVANALISEWSAFIRTAFQAGDGVIDQYRAAKASYAVEIIFPLSTLRFRIQFLQEDFELTRNEAAAKPADIEHRITASALTAWSRRDKSYFYLRAFSRTYSALYSVQREGDGIRVDNRVLPDLLGDFVQWKMAGADMALKVRLDNQLRPFLRTKPGPTEP